MKKFDYYILYPFTQEAVLFTFMFLLGCFCIILSYTSPFIQDLINRCIELFLETYVLIYLLCLTPHRIRPYTRGLICFTAYLVAFLDTFCYIRLGSTISANITQLIWETNINEVSGFLNSFISWDLLYSPIGIIIIISIVHTIVHFYYHEKTNTLFTIIFKTKTISCIILCILLIRGLCLFLPNVSNRIAFFQLKTEKELADFYACDYRRIKINYLPIYRITTALYTNLLSLKQIKTYLSNFAKVQIDNCDFCSPNIVLIIGESYNKHHSQLYGYKMLTTPFQLKEDLYVYQDAVTSHNLTSEVFKNLFSLNDYSNHEEWCDKPLFPQIFKEAGYNVSFISNQFVMDDMSDFTAGAFINNPNISNLQFSKRNNKTHFYDGELWASYNSMKIDPNKYNLTIFHLVGQHFNYKDRYPKPYKELASKAYHRKELTERELSILMAYDNATRYNDDIIKSLIEYYYDTNTIILYLSDHGEECYDEIKTFGRSHNNQLNKQIVKNEFEIPFWIWCSKTYKQSHPQIVTAIESSINKPFYSSDLGHLMLFLAGISCSYYQEKRNILSSHYNTSNKRLIRGTALYEDIIK